ncbi:hypothetical protein ALC57_18346 [Trachymyrmex cornetzi]|uniref:Uncharacterized protein n=1 Tax=Trachymyrmex cornetzi TaxID=471704 RepID=A0A151IS70_9HYME|nr:hypothetical protein ALC57_18346 [Trachymyrmex cornetzi]
MLSICISFGVCRGALKADFHNNTREDGELIVLQSLEQRFAPNVERGWACEREQPFVCK